MFLQKQYFFYFHSKKVENIVKKMKTIYLSWSILVVRQDFPTPPPPKIKLIRNNSRNIFLKLEIFSCTWRKLGFKDIRHNILNRTNRTH